MGNSFREKNQRTRNLNQSKRKLNRSENWTTIDLIKKKLLVSTSWTNSMHLRKFPFYFSANASVERSFMLFFRRALTVNGKGSLHVKCCNRIKIKMSIWRWICLEWKRSNYFYRCQITLFVLKNTSWNSLLFCFWLCK